MSRGEGGVTDLGIILKKVFLAASVCTSIHPSLNKVFYRKEHF